MDECREMGPVCGNGTCSNVIGGFECDCRDGFTAGPSQTCEGLFKIYLQFKNCNLGHLTAGSPQPVTGAGTGFYEGPPWN